MNRRAANLSMQVLVYMAVAVLLVGCSKGKRLIVVNGLPYAVQLKIRLRTEVSVVVPAQSVWRSEEALLPDDPGPLSFGYSPKGGGEEHTGVLKDMELAKRSGSDVVVLELPSLSTAQ